MAIWKLDFQYVLNTEYWTNKFYISEESTAGVNEAVAAIAEVLKSGIQNSVTIDKCRVTPAPFARNTFYDIPLNVVGTGGAAAPAPLFNVVRWIWGRAYGRGVMHYFRGGVIPGNIGSNGLFTADAQAFNQQLLSALFDAPTVFTDESGRAYTRAAASPRVGMRQLRRGSKRSKTPVI